MIIRNGKVALPGKDKLEELDIRITGEKIVELGFDQIGRAHV